MTNLAQDTFDRPDGSDWNTASDGTTVWSGVRGSTTYTIASNQGAAAGNSASYCIARAGSGTSADTDQVVTVKRVDSNDVAGLVCRYANNNNYYACTIGQFANNLSFDKMVSGSYTNVAFGPNTTYAVGTTWKIRMRVIGTSVKVRIWDASGAEPSTWDIDTTDSSLSSAGGYGIYLDPWTNTSTKLSFNDYLATDGTTTTTNTRTITNEAVLLATRSRTVQGNAVLQTTPSRTLTNEAVLLATRARALTNEAVLQATRTRTVQGEAVLSRTNTRTISGEAVILATRSRATPGEAVLMVTRTRAISCHAVLSGTVHSHPNCTVIVRSGNATAIVSSGSATTLVPSGEATAIIRS